MELEVCCPICKTVQTHVLAGHPCQLRCQVPECRALFEYVGHCHLFLDIFHERFLSEYGRSSAPPPI